MGPFLPTVVFRISCSNSDINDHSYVSNRTLMFLYKPSYLNGNESFYKENCIAWSLQNIKIQNQIFPLKQKEV